jgi:hypothetical protein
VMAKHVNRAYIVIDDGQSISALTPTVTGAEVDPGKLQVKGGPVDVHRSSDPSPDHVAPMSYSPSGA